ncbi:hypothetical protein LGZ29_004596 [Escherichia coli]|uniref:hypothetical protein n=2 Tax=Escherichia coli TaxID=562 RepID=UPI0007A04D75|nr:hypothetical protein [Escherichia coli]EMC8921883.1 hypothetical protein [Shigella sonnei]EII1487419.1 hypothetical protein [Escherichia coli]EJB6589375.1 hypothetical protein [Escherichia coli]EJC7309912.1 hypothetical protein [Escherichia coli]EJE9931379.1 hypothetical protein [Escherichia coli]
MYIIGFIFYLMIVVSYFYVDEIYEIINQSYILAEAITLTMGILYIYPLVIFLFICVFSKKTQKHKKLIDSQTKIAASVAVSVGLIGTFQGLTAMVSAIASSMGGEGDMSEKMGSMLSAISSALSAMSYAFLTSILGVAVSVLLLLSLNFWLFYFKDPINEEQQKKHYPIKLKYNDALLNSLNNIENNINSMHQSILQEKVMHDNKIQANEKLISLNKELLVELKNISKYMNNNMVYNKECISQLSAEYNAMKEKIKRSLEYMIK